MTERVNFSQAKADHLAWKHKVRNFLDGTEIMDRSEIVSHLTCRMGKWFYAEGKEEFGHLDTIKKFELKHIKLHKLAKDIYDLKQIEDLDLAEELYLDLDATSQAIIALLAEAENILNKDIIVEIQKQENYKFVVAWDKSKTIITETDINGDFIYVNEVFSLVSGYTDLDVIGKSQNIIQHPDMPEIIDKWLWESINSSKITPLIVKNLSKSGKYYWVIVNYKINYDANNQIKSIYVKQNGLNREIIDNHIEPLYKKLKHLEDFNGIESSENFLKGYLKERNRTFEEFISNLLMTGRDTVKSDKKGFFNRLFNRN